MFQWLLSFLSPLGFKSEELFSFFDESLFQLERLDDLLIKYDVDKEVIRLATRKKNDLILALKDFRKK